MIVCSCERCRRKEDMVSHYMAVLGIGYPEAIGVLQAESQGFFIAAMEHAQEHHGLDLDAARAHVRTHAADPPERLQ